MISLQSGVSCNYGKTDNGMKGIKLSNLYGSNREEN